MEQRAYETTRFGQARRTPGRHGYVAYFPAVIPRTVEVPAATVHLLADAEAALGRLAGVGQLLPNPHLLIRPYLLREALSSTRIEGTQASLADVFETEASGEAPNADVEEVLNYIQALEWGLRELDRLPLGVRLICEMHRRLLAGVRGRERMPGEFRTTQNWVGAVGSTIETARFVPPPPHELPALLSDWERYVHEETEVPLLVKHALLHYQFETLHPFLDGNGRLGRLLSVFLLVEHERLSAPLLYLSTYLERDRERYYEALQTVRERGDAVPWLDLFLEAIRTQAVDAVARAQRIIELRERYRAAASAIASSKAMALVDLVCEVPIVSSRIVETRLDVTRPTALKLLRQLEGVGVLQQGTGGPRGQRRYLAHELMAAVADDGAGTNG
ncbi:MAG TPA: Fic family protein [Conexibacter sp.]|jgi:Fic family protein|nr:Fic family protein [Conexibacter sp.]